MRHGKKNNHLGRTSAHRKALMSNLAGELIMHKHINTTLAKAKALRKYVEPLITKAKNDSTHNRRLVFNKLQDKHATKELFLNVSSKVGDRPGGYTRIIKLPPRMGDAAAMAMIELVDFNTLYTKPSAADGKKKTRRSRRGGKKSSTNVATENAVNDQAEALKSESPKAEAPKKEAEAKAAKKENDDLTKIEGIGPKVSEALSKVGITTFTQLSEKSADEIKTILEEADGHFNMQDPTTWPEQAKMAAEGKWDELKKWQDELDGGKEAE